MGDPIIEVTELHTSLGAANVVRNVTALPGGWNVMTRQWGPGCWDAVIIAPAPHIGWRLADPFAPTEQVARNRAHAEIGAHLARRDTP